MKRKPTELKIVQGNPGKRPLNKDEPKPAEAVAPKPPPWLDNNGLHAWETVVPELERLGLLTDVDLIALAHFCSWHSTFLWASREIEMDGMTLTDNSGRQYKNPAMNIKDAASKHVRAFGSEFGLTPSTRGGMVVPKGRRNADDSKEAKARRILDKK